MAPVLLCETDRCLVLVIQIDRDELRAGFLKLGEKLSEEDIDAIMELADDDGDDSIDITVPPRLPRVRFSACHVVA